MVARTRAPHEHKRHGTHQKHTRHFLKVYHPYLPFLFIVAVGLVFSAYWQPRTQRGVLAYATSMSVAELLQATNQQRLANGSASLGSNASLNQAAQAKANDMATRDYWSHNTPDGNPPWIFIDQTGYTYKLAGENLAYGFMTGGDTVAGWMNSPSHKANLLNSGFTEVGFGFANADNYQNSGPETIVVAMYAAPLIITPVAAVQPAQTSQAPPISQPKTATAITEPQATAEPKAQSPPQEKREAVEPAEVPVTTASVIREPASKSISRLETLTQGSLPWAMSAVTIVGAMAILSFLIKHSLALHKFLVRGERYVLHHMVFDITVVSLAGLSLIVSQTAGFIR